MSRTRDSVVERLRLPARAAPQEATEELVPAECQKEIERHKTNNNNNFLIAKDETCECDKLSFRKIGRTKVCKIGRTTHSLHGRQVRIKRCTKGNRCRAAGCQYVDTGRMKVGNLKLKKNQMDEVNNSLSSREISKFEVHQMNLFWKTQDRTPFLCSETAPACISGITNKKSPNYKSHALQWEFLRLQYCSGGG